MHLVDAHLCTDPAKYISALVLSLSTMLHLELPHINLLSKVDLIEQYGKLRFNLDFYTEVGTDAATNVQQWEQCYTQLTNANCACGLQVQDLSYLVKSMGDDAFSKRYQKLSQGLCEV